MTGDRVRKRLEPDPQEAEIVRTVFKLRLFGDGESGPLGSKGIAQWLNARGFRSREGNIFYVNRVHRILTDEVCVGRYWSNRKVTKTGRVRPKEEWILTQVEPIINEETYARAQVLLADSRPTVTPPRSISNDVLLSGLAFCASCNGPMTTDAGRGKQKKNYYYYYVCSPSKLRANSECSCLVRISRPALDDLVIDALCDEVLVQSRMEEILARLSHHRKSNKGDRSRELTQLKAERLKIEKSIDRLIHGIISGSLAPTPKVRAAQEELESGLGRVCALIEAKEKTAATDVRKLGAHELDQHCSVLRQRLSG